MDRISHSFIGSTRLLGVVAAFCCAAVLGAAPDAPTAAATRTSVVPGRVLDVAPLASTDGDLVVFAGGLESGWREGMRAFVVRGDLRVAELTVVRSGSRASAAVIDSLASDVRIGAGDTVFVKIQQLSN